MAAGPALIVAAQNSPSSPRPGEIVASKPAPARPASAGSDATNTDPNKGTGVIRGRILLANGRPARRASIQLAWSGSPRATAADDEGKYEFTDLPADSYRLSAGKPGYLVLEYGQQRAFERGKLITLGDGETLEKIDVTLPASGAIAGRIVDENGDPVEAVTVRLLQSQFAANRRQLVDVSAAGARATDDTGHYRIFGVPPGQYVVVASVVDRLPPATSSPDITPADTPPADLPGYAPTYYPGTFLVSEARLVSVGISQDVSSVDFALAPAPTAGLSGIALDSGGQPAGVLLNRSQRSGGFGERPMRDNASADGSFRFENLPPGEYVLQTTGQRRDQAIEPDFTSMYVVVDGKDTSGLVLQGTSGSTMSGRVTFEGLAADAKPPAVQLTAWPSDFDRSPMSPADIGRTRVGDDGRFALGGLQGPRRVRLLQAPASWSLKAVRVNGVDVTDDVITFGTRQESLADVEVVLTNRGPSLTGAVTDVSGRPVTDYTVVAFAADEERWYQRSRFMNFTRPRHDGTFAMPALAAGDYYVAAVDSLQGAEGWGEWQDPDFLRAIAPAATRVTLGDGQAAALALRLIAR
jgi:protocatechuate 3,4-dioxygenase beta subunit